MTATAAMENAVGSGKISNKEDRLHRGRKVTMAFLMQGWGQVCGAFRHFSFQSDTRLWQYFSIVRNRSGSNH